MKVNERTTISGVGSFSDASSEMNGRGEALAAYRLYEVVSWFVRK